MELTNSMEPYPWETNKRLATHKFNNILWNPKIHYHVHKGLQLVPVMNQMNPDHTTSSYFSKIQFNTVLQPTSYMILTVLSFGLSHQNLVCILLLSHSYYMPCPYHNPLLNHYNYVSWRVQVMKLLSLWSSPNVKNQISGLYKTIHITVVLYWTNMYNFLNVSHCNWSV
jgi:hypothetical protein